MSPLPVEELVHSETAANGPMNDTPEVTDIDPLNVLHFLRSAGNGIMSHAALYGQLISVEWGIEKRRLTHQLLTTVLGFACLFFVLVMAIVLILALSWETAYRVPAIIALMMIFVLGVMMAWFNFRKLSIQQQQAFSALQAEIMKDLGLLKSALRGSRT